jgi:hypothetical protein
MSVNIVNEALTCLYTFSRYSEQTAGRRIYFFFDYRKLPSSESHFYFDNEEFRV